MKRRGFVSRGAAAANSRHVRCIRGGRRSYMKRRGFVSRGGGGSEHQARPPYSRLPALQGTGMRGGFCRSAGRREHGHGALAHAECRTAAFAARAAPARTGKHHGVQMRSRPFPFLRRLTIMRALSGPIAQLGERCVRNAEVGSSILLRSTTFQRPDIALAFFMVARNPSVGAGFAFCAKRASSPRGPVFEGFSPSVLSVLCFCESRLSHVVHTNQWVAWAGLTRHLAGGGDRSAAERISAVQARLRKRPSRNPGRTCVPRFRTLRAASLPRHHRAGSPPSASRRPACGIAA